MSHNNSLLSENYKKKLNGEPESKAIVKTEPEKKPEPKPVFESKAVPMTREMKVIDMSEQIKVLTKAINDDLVKQFNEFSNTIRLKVTAMNMDNLKSLKALHMEMQGQMNIEHRRVLAEIHDTVKADISEVIKNCNSVVLATINEYVTNQINIHFKMARESLQQLFQERLGRANSRIDELLIRVSKLEQGINQK